MNHKGTKGTKKTGREQSVLRTLFLIFLFFVPFVPLWLMPLTTHGKYRAVTVRKYASDWAISPMPFMPSSMLTQPL